MEDKISSDCDDFDSPFDCIGNNIILNDKDNNFNDVSMLKTEVLALKMFVT